MLNKPVNLVTLDLEGLTAVLGDYESRLSALENADNGAPVVAPDQEKLPDVPPVPAPVVEPPSADLTATEPPALGPQPTGGAMDAGPVNAVSQADIEAELAAAKEDEAKENEATSDAPASV